MGGTYSHRQRRNRRGCCQNERRLFKALDPVRGPALRETLEQGECTIVLKPGEHLLDGPVAINGHVTIIGEYDLSTGIKASIILKSANSVSSTFEETAGDHAATARSKREQVYGEEARQSQVDISVRSYEGSERVFSESILSRADFDEKAMFSVLDAYASLVLEHVTIEGKDGIDAISIGEGNLVARNSKFMVAPIRRSDRYSNKECLGGSINVNGCTFTSDVRLENCNAIVRNSQFCNCTIYIDSCTILLNENEFVDCHEHAVVITGSTAGAVTQNVFANYHKSVQFRSDWEQNQIKVEKRGLIEVEGNAFNSWSGSRPRGGRSYCSMWNPYPATTRSQRRSSSAQ